MARLVDGVQLGAWNDIDGVAIVADIGPWDEWVGLADRPADPSPTEALAWAVAVLTVGSPTRSNAARIAARSESRATASGRRRTGMTSRSFTTVGRGEDRRRLGQEDRLVRVARRSSASAPAAGPRRRGPSVAAWAAVRWPYSSASCASAPRNVDSQTSMSTSAASSRARVAHPGVHDEGHLLARTVLAHLARGAPCAEPT